MAIQAQIAVPSKDPVLAAPLPRFRHSNAEKLAAFRMALNSRGYRELTRVRLDIDHAVVTLFGEVSSFYMKQLAQEALRPLSIGMRIDNQIHVTH